MKTRAIGCIIYLVFTSVSLASSDFKRQVDTLRANSYLERGFDYYKKYEYSNAIRCYEIAASDYKARRQNNRYLSVLNRIAFCQMSLSNYSDGLDNVNRSIAINRKLNRTDSLEFAYSLNVKAGIYRMFGLQDLAIENLESAIRIRRSILPLHELSNSFTNLATLYSNKGQQLKAIELFEIGYHLESQKPKLLVRDSIIYHLNIGLAYHRLRNDSIAFNHYFDALEISIRNIDKYHSEIGRIYGNIGLLYWERSDFKRAEYYLNKGLENLNNSLEMNYYELSRLKSIMGLVLRDIENYDTALQHFIESAEVASNLSGAASVRQSIAYSHISELYIRKGEPDSSLLYAQKGIKALFPEFQETHFSSNPVIGSYCQHGANVLEILSNKARALEGLHETTGNVDFIQAALNAYMTCDSLIVLERNSRLNIQDKLQFGQKADELYSNAVELCSKMFLRTNDRQYIELLFYFNEKNKGQNLLNATRAPRLVKGPNRIRELEDSILNAMSLYRSGQIYSKDSDKALKYNLLYINAEEALGRFYEKYRKHFETGEVSILKLGEIESSLLESDAIIHYKMSTDHIISLVTTQNETAHLQRSIDSTFISKIRQFRINASRVDRDEDKLVNLSSEISSIIIGDHLKYLKSLDRRIDRLIIIPDGILGYVPFELLSENQGRGEVKSNARPYLIRNYTITYGYSSTLLVDKSNIKRFSSKPSKVLNTFVGFAPSYNMGPIRRSSFDESVNDLDWNEPEVAELSNLLEGRGYLALEATESSFKRTANNHRIIHLATHAIVDNEDPMNSKLLFSPIDSLEDGFLHAYELYNMNLNSDLAVLSACNTGYGKLTKGEGIMSLGMGFAFAGVPSIVMSHWNANDRTTADLMKLFYQYLAEGYEKDVALRQAKLDFLATATDDIAHPYYWGGFVIMGDTSPIKLQNHSKDWVTIGVILLTALVSLTLFTPHYSNSRH